MNRNNVLTVMSLLAIVLLSFHLTDDIVYGSDKSPAINVAAIAILITWLFGTLALARRRSGYAIVLLGSLVGIGVFVIHARGPGGLPAGKIAQSSGAFFFVWTLLALAVSSVFSAILAALQLWTNITLRARRPSRATDPTARS